MPLHPLTQFMIAASFLASVLTLPLTFSGLFVPVAFLGVAAIPPRTEVTKILPFLKLLAIGAVSLVLIHGVRWLPPGIDRDGLTDAAGYLVRIGAVFVSILYLIRQVTGDDLFAVLLDLHVPRPLILILFRTVWLLPRFIERTREVTTAQQLRGMRIDTARARLRAVLPSLIPITVSMLYETYDHAMTMTIRGFLTPGAKTHVHPLRFGFGDAVAMLACLCAVALTLIVRMAG